MNWLSDEEIDDMALGNCHWSNDNADLLFAQAKEVNRLRHDNDRLMAIAQAETEESNRLRSENEALERNLVNAHKEVHAADRLREGLEALKKDIVDAMHEMGEPIGEREKGVLDIEAVIAVKLAKLLEGK